ncbi:MULTISPECIES: YegS/Rv2252/BmrU family lipid kinase [Cyanophyceae]|uniref:YegS/Rv2252/BmrU family lipid kinase n=1 Tax=Cyanophyceae TaxID=3028117 RepID=UPI001685B2C0|nr:MULTISPECIES: YegS/Rv2252/BmrU family lipid kinase [Cyanophyceae]MBD1918009.1 YegS/Rv2252/BmrU family lipid kinase [Phormidium sp. FACHB-77]MBD2029257.1 YegS/Rv2252/BmrU family lipid kinase [Phormidium sp. FACHB-322]MBD2049789.1 YegS/Rv2252/BmrU family lipid kinase [Leptolyngbya sp. FACHB-60]
MPSTLAILAHPTQVTFVLDWLSKNEGVLTHFQIMAPAEMARGIDQGWDSKNIELVTLKESSQGGDIELAAHILAGEVAGVIFFTDPEAIAFAFPSFSLVLRACQLQGIPAALNAMSATLLLRGIAESQIAYLIFNPVAGQGNPNTDLALIKEVLEPQILVNVIMTKPEVDPAEQAQDVIAHIRSKTEHDMGRSLIIASGGDGTVSAVAGATIGTGIPLGVIPRGTANAFSVGLGIPTNLRAACETILAGNTHIIDAARCNDIPMILLAGLGFEAGMVDGASRQLKNELGNLAYVLSGVRQLAAAEPFTATLEIDGEVTTVTTTAITVANVAPSTSVLAQGLGEVIPDDGLLEITIATSTTRLQGINALASLVAAAAWGNPTQRDDITCLRARRIKVTTDPPQKLVVDGEILEINPVLFECLPDALTVFAPLQTL